VSIGDFVAMNPAIIVWGGIETALATLFKPLILDTSLEFPQIV
jgi:hypothetical protein